MCEFHHNVFDKFCIILIQSCWVGVGVPRPNISLYALTISIHNSSWGFIFLFVSGLLVVF